MKILADTRSQSRPTPSSMELQEIFNRIDRLEQLILSHAKDIDRLRNLIQSDRLTCNDPECRNCESCQNQVGSPNGLAMNIWTQAPNTDVALGPATCNGYNGDEFNQEQPPSPVYKSYVMNRVHPANAIPPVARIVLTRAETLKYHQEDRARNCLEQSKHQGHESFEDEPYSRIVTKNITSKRVMPSNIQLSTVKSSSLGALNGYEPPREQPMRDKSPFTLIELVTCFCPCFNLC